MKPIPTIICVVILGRIAPIYEGIEQIFGFSSNYYYVWIWSWATNLSGILWAAMAYRLISPEKLWIRAVVMAYGWGVFFDSLGMFSADLERYDSLWWELLCMAWGLVFGALITVPLKHRKIQRIKREEMAVKEQMEAELDEENKRIIKLWFG